MLRRALSWDPPLYVTVPLLFAVSCGLSLALSGAVTPIALVLAVVASWAQWLRKRRVQGPHS